MERILFNASALCRLPVRTMEFADDVTSSGDLARIRRDRMTRDGSRPSQPGGHCGALPGTLARNLFCALLFVFVLHISVAAGQPMRHLPLAIVTCSWSLVISHL